MKDILEFGLFLGVIFSPVILLWLIYELSTIIANKIIKNKRG